MHQDTEKIMLFYEQMNSEGKKMFFRLVAVFARESEEARNIFDQYINQLKTGPQIKLSDFEKKITEAERAAAGAPWCKWAIESGWPEILQSFPR